MKKAFFYFKHILLMIRVNMIRNILTSIGIFVAVVVFSMGLIVSDSYYGSKFAIVNEALEDTVITVSLQGISYESVFSEDNIFFFDNMGRYPKVFWTGKVTQGQYLAFNGWVHGVSSEESTRMYTDDDGYCLTSSLKVIEGRNITLQDIVDGKHVAVIEKTVADTIWPNASCIGKSVNFNDKIGKIAIGTEKTDNDADDFLYTIIGVVANSEVTEQRIRDAENQIRNGEESTVFVDVPIYIPFSTVGELFSEEEVNRYSVFSFNNAEDALSFSKTAEKYSGPKNQLKVYTRGMLEKQLSEKLRNTKYMLVFVTSFLCILSAISIMGIVFFSVKERIPEMGIRRAFGASSIDITFQLFLEVVVVAIVSSSLAVVFSYGICYGMQNVLLQWMHIVLKIEIKLQNVFLPILVGTAVAIFSVFFPCISMSRISVTDALRFE